jgi:uncharacterized membrane protein YkoI
VINKYRITIAALLASAAAAGGITVAANGPNDAPADVAKAQVTIAQAIAAAEQAAGGKATSAELENEQAGLVYKVEVVNPATRKVMDVQVDGTSGKVIASKQDTADGNNKDEEDED